jgi:hypothetical protein
LSARFRAWDFLEKLRAADDAADILSHSGYTRSSGS